MNIANLISLFRAAILPVVLYLVYQETVIASAWAFILLCLALVSDVLDGYVARRRRERSKIGSFLDPFADKLLIGGLLLAYTIWGSFWWTALLILVVRDVIAGTIRWYAAQDEVVLEKWLSGKVVTYPQFVLLLVLVLRDLLRYDLSFLPNLTQAMDSVVFLVTIIVVGLTVLSVIEYSARYFKGLGRRIRKGRKLKQEKMVVLVNKRSSGYKNRYRRRLLRKFAKKRNARILYLPRTENMYKGIEKLIPDADHIIIAGGDGSFESALSYKPFHKKSLGFFPLGAGNAYYSYFYIGKRFEYLRSRFRFQEMPLDILELHSPHGKVQTTFVAAGVDAAVMGAAKDDRTKNGLRDYLKASWRVFWGLDINFNFTCKVGRKTHELENCVNFTISKIPYYGFSIRSILGKIRATDGNAYGLAVVNTHSPIFNKPLRIWAFLLAAMHLNKSPLVPFKGRTFEIRSDTKFPIQAGGEYIGMTKWMKVKVLRKQKVLVI